MLSEINSSFSVFLSGCFQQSANELASPLRHYEAGENRDLVYADTYAPLLELSQIILIRKHNLHSWCRRPSLDNFF